MSHQPTNWFRRKNADKTHFYSLYSVVTLKIRSRSPKSNHFILIIPMIQYIKFGQNPSFGSRDRMQTSFFWSRFDFQSAGVALKGSPKSNHFFPMSKWCFHASLVKIHQMVLETECRQGSFYNLYKNLIKFLNHPNVIIYEVWPESVIWFKR